MIDLKVPIDEELLAKINHICQPLGLEISAVVSEALMAWVKQHEAQNFEQKWIKALQQNPDEAKKAEAWRHAQVWSEE